MEKKNGKNSAGKTLVKRPCIGITGPDKGGLAAWIFTSWAIRLAGGKPLRLKPGKTSKAKHINGLIIGGGADIDPRAYTQDNFLQSYLSLTLKDKKTGFLKKILRFITWIYYPLVFIMRKILSRKSGGIDKDRDELEFNLINKAYQNNLPILGICRGAQLINVYFKGTLHSSIAQFYDEEPNRHSIFPVKDVTLNPGSKLQGIFNEKHLLVNALHNQAVDKKGENIDIVAWEKNSVVQGIESHNTPFIIGVQWHPEYLINRSLHRKLFKSLVQAAQQVGNRQIQLSTS